MIRNNLKIACTLEKDFKTVTNQLRLGNNLVNNMYG